MRKNKTNYDMAYNTNKNKIIFNIYSVILTEEYISSKNCKINNNNNDTLNFITNIFIFLESIIYSLYEYIINYLPSFIRIFYRIQYFLIIILLFKFSFSLEENSYISTNLIISAYFPTSQHLIHVEYDNIMLFENKTQYNPKMKNIKIKIKNNFNIKDKLIDCENKYINKELKSITSSIINKKNIYVNYKKKLNNNKDDIYLFFIIPIKTSLFSFGSFILLYFFIKITYSSKINTSFIFNIFSMFFIYNITDSLYFNNYFLSSTFMFILFIYLFKCFIDSIYLLFRFKKKDFEIFSTNLTALNYQQFILKFIILSLITIISGLMSIYTYKLCLNYIIFYLCLLTLMVFLCNCLELYSPLYLKPIKNILMFIVGLINFIICKYYLSKDKTNSVFDINSNYILLTEEKDNNKIIGNSLYFVSHLFSLFCFDYLREYIDYHFNDNFKFYKKLTLLDFIIITFFLSSFGIGIIGIIKNEYICLILSVYIAKVSIVYFINAFNIKISRIINHIVMIFFIIIHFKISIKGDHFLIDFFSFSKINSKLLSHIFSFLSLIITIYYGLKIYSYLYCSKEILNNDKLKELPEEQVNKILEFTSNINKQKLKNLKIQIIHDNDKYKMQNIFYNLFDILFSHIEICLIFVIINDYDVNFMIKILYLFLIILFNLIKFLIAKDIQNKAEYLSTFFISFAFTLRILLLSLSTSKILFFICQINLLFLIITYSINNNKNKIISLIIIFYLLFNLSKVDSFFLILDLILLIISPNFKDYFIKNNNITKNNNNNEKKDEQKKLLLLLFLFIFIILSWQLYGFCNYNNILNYCNINLFNNITKNILDVLKKNNNKKKKISIEYYIINEIYSFLLNNN